MGMLGSMALATSSVMPKSAAKVCTSGAPCQPAANGVATIVTEIMQLRIQQLLRRMNKTRDSVAMHIIRREQTGVARLHSCGQRGVSFGKNSALTHLCRDIANQGGHINIGEAAGVKD